MGLFRVRGRLTGPTGRSEGADPLGRHRSTLLVTTPCFIAPDGPALLGAVALESLFLAVDPVAKRLISVEGFVC